jgi:hypothetical protein
MSSLAPLPSLSVLQASFSAGLSTLSAEAATQALADIRQVSAFSGISTLTDLVSPDAIARLVFKPSLFQEGAGRLRAFRDLEELGAMSRLPTIKERLRASAQVLDLRHGAQIYGAMLVHSERPDELQDLQASMSRALKDELKWPRDLTTETLGDFAVSVRKTFNAHGDYLTAEQRHDLMQIAARLNGAAGDVCAFDADQDVSPIQARKLGALVALLYGSGFGDDASESVSEGLRRLARNWGKLDVMEREKRLRLLADSAKKLLEEVKTSYADLFDPIGAVPFFRLHGAIAPLTAHLAALLP